MSDDASHALMFLAKVCQTANAIDAKQIEAMADRLMKLREAGGRLFILGLGGSAANASHAVNDFVKLCGIHAFAPTDNAAEMTARINDEGWLCWLSDWLAARSLSSTDAILVLSVGGGDMVKEVSLSVVMAVCLAKTRSATIMGIVGRDGGYTKINGDIIVQVPTVDPDLVTPLAESFQSVVLHSLVSHPKLATKKAKWEGLTAEAKPLPGDRVSIKGTPLTGFVFNLVGDRATVYRDDSNSPWMGPAANLRVLRYA